MLLLICGLPATGKTTFGEWLHNTHGFLHLDLEMRDCLTRNYLPRFWLERIWNLDKAGLAQFVTYLKVRDQSTVLTWAFHTDLIPFVAQLKDHGFVLWWFEGDRLAIRDSYLARGRVLVSGVAYQGTPDIIKCDRYVASLISHWHAIAPLFEPNIVRTLQPDGTYLAAEYIFQQIIS